MLSGVASDQEVQELSRRFSSGELVRMMSLIQSTAAGFTRSTSRRMDAELCIVNLCRPELQLDGESLNARLTRIEDQIRSGNLVFSGKAPESNGAVSAEPLLSFRRNRSLNRSWCPRRLWASGQRWQSRCGRLCSRHTPVSLPHLPTRPCRACSRATGFCWSAPMILPGND